MKVQEQIIFCESALTRQFKLCDEAEEHEKWLLTMFIEPLNSKLEILYKQMRFYTSGNKRNKYDFELIRAVPMKAIMGDSISEQYGRAKYICPLHKEKTPSFTVYKKTNSWYCFGCGRGGSNIDFVMLRYNLSVADAIAKLNNYI